MMDYFKNRRLIWILIGTLVILNLFSLSALLWSINRTPRIRSHPANHLEKRLLKGLRFDRDQRQSVLEFRSKEEEKIRNLQDQIARIKRDLAFNSSHYSEDKRALDSLLTELGEMHADLERIHFEMLQQIREISSSEQEEKLNKYLERMEKQRAHARKRQKELRSKHTKGIGKQESKEKTN